MSRAIRMVFRSNLDEPLPEMVSKTSKRRETSLKKSKKRQAIASAGSGALGSLWGLWELLGGSWRAWGGLQGAPYIDKTPDQPHGGRYVSNIRQASECLWRPKGNLQETCSLKVYSL